MKPPTYRYRLYMVTNALGEVYYQAKEPHGLLWWWNWVSHRGLQSNEPKWIDTDLCGNHAVRRSGRDDMVTLLLAYSYGQQKKKDLIADSFKRSQIVVEFQEEISLDGTPPSVAPTLPSSTTNSTT